MRAALFLGLLIACARPAAAHPAPFSYLDLRIHESGVYGTLTLHALDLARDLGTATPSELLDVGTLARERGRIVAVVAPRLRFRGGSSELQAEWAAIEPSRERDAVRLAFRLPPVRDSLAVHVRLFPYDPLHQTFLTVYEEGTLRQQAVIGAGGGERTFYRGTAEGKLAVARTFVRSGVHHILIGPDHILFLVGLLLLGGGWRPLVAIATAFTVGHSITLSLAALGVFSPPASIVEPAIALSIVFVGADNLLVGRSGRDIRAWAALVFGLVHGFGFASVLREFGLPTESLAWSLLSFNVGVEIGQLAIVGAVAAALTTIRRRNDVAARRLTTAGSIVVMAAGAYWFVERVFLT